jgi:ATP-binding cassette subfamily B protein
MPTNLVSLFLHFMRKYPVAFTVFYLAPLIVLLEAVVMPYALKMVIDAFNAHENDRETIMEHIEPALWLGGGAWVTLVISARLQEWWQVHVMPKFEADIRMTMLDYVTKHSHDYFSNSLSGNIANKIHDLPRAMDSFNINLRWNGVTTFALVIVSLCILWTIQPLFAAIMALWVVGDIGVSFSFVRYVNTAAEQNAADKSVLSGRIVDTISNIVSVKLFARRTHELAYIGQTQETEIESNKMLKWRINIYRFFVDLPVTIMWGVMGYLLITYWKADKITTGDFVFIFNSIWSLMFRLWFFGEALSQMFKDAGVIRQALSLVTVKHGIVDAKDAMPLEVTRGEIDFEDVTFRYKRGENIFEDKNITIEAGQKVGLVGFSGSGKSTFVNLILRFFDVEAGQITIDGQNIAHVTQESLRSQIAMIPQDTSLFHRSLMENIRYGRITATDDEVIAAARRAHCDEFVRQMPEGYYTIVGERGMKLSGGQRQRIAIARAMLKNAPILILDEATSALDSITERMIQESLHEAMEGKTAIVVAHRLSTLSEMDRILMFEDGHIIEDGSHDELVELGGKYAKLWEMQAGGFLPEDEG